MGYVIDPATGQRIEVHQDPWGRRHPVAAPVIAVLAGAVAGRIAIAAMSAGSATVGAAGGLVWLVVFAGTTLGVLLTLRGPRRR